MATVIKNMNDLKKQVDTACSKAVENACNRLSDEMVDSLDIQSLFS